MKDAPDDRDLRAASDATTEGDGREGRHGERIGPFELLEVIGEGGFGVVWLAERREPMVQRVALKVLKPGLDTRRVLARFEAERQALAVMDHPGIARVFDAGETPRGLPYFAMELVRGEPITTYCDRQQLTLRERIALFIDVCRAVQHAHHKGIIHRDLKPSNILVGVADDRPLPKVIDFGIAKAVSPALGERTAFTEHGQVIGTPEYMSPEQAEGGRLDVDTRTDLYSLGVVLYELLTGALPFDAAALRQAVLARAPEFLRAHDPQRPSTRVSDLGPHSLEVAHKRRTDPTRLSRLLRGDLDWIVLRALEKDRTRRYETAHALALDLERHLRHQPVEAGPPSAAYRLRKFARRHRVGLAVSAAVAVALLAGAAATAVALVGQARARADAERQRAKADSVVEFLTEEVLAGATPARIPDKAVRDTIVAAMLDPAAESVGQSLADEPLVEAEVRNVLGESYRAIGRPDLAVPQARTAFDLRRRVLGDDQLDTLISYNNLAIALWESGRPDECEPLLREGIARSRPALGQDHPHTLIMLHNLSQLLLEQGEMEQAEGMLREVVEVHERVLPDDDEDKAATVLNLAWILGRQGKIDEAVTLGRAGLELARRALGATHPVTTRGSHTLAHLLREQGQLTEAATLARAALATSIAVLGDEHLRTLEARVTLAAVFFDRGEYTEAEALWRQAVGQAERTLDDTHALTIESRANLGTSLVRLDRLAEAQRLLQQALRAVREAFGDGHVRTLRVLGRQAELLQAQGDPDRAAELWQAIFTQAPTAKEGSPMHAARLMAGWGPALVGLGRTREAEEPLREAHRRLTETKQTHHEGMRAVVAALAEMCERTERPEDAARWRAELAALEPAR